MDHSNRKASAPPSFNIPVTRARIGACTSPVFARANSARAAIDNATKYQERVKKLSDKTDKLINAHRNAQQVNGNGSTGSTQGVNSGVNSGVNPGINSGSRSISLGSMAQNTPSIVQIPPSPVIKKHQDFNAVSEPLTVTCENGKKKSKDILKVS